MFRIEFFVDDKRLAAALHALVGVSHGPPTVQPVVNAAKQGNGLAAVSDGSSIELLAAELKKMRGQEITASAHGNALMKAIGIAPASKTYMLKRATQAGLLKAHGKGSGMKYRVL
jgi:hypothetical protein